MNFRIIIFCLLFFIFPVMSCMAQTFLEDSVIVFPYQVDEEYKEDSLVEQPNEIDILKDSIEVLLERIRLLEQQQQAWRRQISFADTCIVRQANNALNAPYDEKRIRSAMLAFDRISSPAYRQQMLPLRQLLADYGTYHNDLISILKRADGDRDLRNPFGGKETAERYIEEIRQTRYFQTVMQKEWVIPYMNRLTENAISRLKANNPGEQQNANLKDLLTP